MKKEKIYIDWFVSYIPMIGAGRTTETKMFKRLMDARSFSVGEVSGYITRCEQGNYTKPEDIKTVFVEYFGGFNPTAQECLKMKRIGLIGIPPVTIEKKK